MTGTSSPQEIRFASDFNGRLQVTAGTFYAKIENDTFWPCSIADGFDDAVTGIPFGTDCVFTTDSSSEVEEVAFFGEFEFAVTDNFFITAGGRFL